jgi:hypothetical protein
MSCTSSWPGCSEASGEHHGAESGGRARHPGAVLADIDEAFAYFVEQFF